MSVGAAMRASSSQASRPTPARGGSRTMSSGRSRSRTARRRKSRVVDSWTVLVEPRLVRAARRSATAVGLASTAVICVEAAREHAGEETDAGVEIPGERAGAWLVVVVADELDEGFEQEAVDLEEAAAGDPVGFVEDAIVEAGGAGFGDDAAGGAGAGVECGGSGGGDEHALRCVGLQRDGGAVERPKMGLVRGAQKKVTWMRFMVWSQKSSTSAVALSQ